MSYETEIVHIGRKSQNECAVVTMIGARSQKALWDSGAGRCIISYDCYNSLHPKYKTGLFPSRVKIKAANGTFIANKGECHITLKINNERFTFPFLCSDLRIPSHPYILVNRSVLCNCGIEAENHFLLESLAACGNANSKLTMYFTVNTVLVNYLDKFPNLTESLEFK